MLSVLKLYARFAWMLSVLLLLGSCRAVLDIKTNVNDLDCATLMEDAYCIKVRTAEIDSVKDLAIDQDRILSNENGFALSWTMPESAKRILGTKVMLASDAACTNEISAAELEIKQLSHKFSEIKDGLYYGCVFAKAKSAGLLAAKNNGIKVIVETAAPKIELQSKIVHSKTSSIVQAPNFTSISAISFDWAKKSGSGELFFSDSKVAAPTITASKDGTYLVTISIFNEAGGKSNRTFTIIFDSVPPKLNKIAPITTSASSVAIAVESDEVPKVYRWEILSAPGGKMPELKDANSATAEMTLPSLGTYTLQVSVEDEAGNVAMTTATVVKEATAVANLSDKTKPTPPVAVAVPSYSPSEGVTATYTAGTDANFSTHNVKACTASDCSTSCLGVTQDVASPVIVGSLVNGTSYWICVQAVDQANNVSAYVPSGNSVTIDTTNPAAPASPAFSSAFINTTTATLSWTNGSDINFSTHNLKACTDVACSAVCTSVTQDAATPGSISGMSAGTSYYACVQTVDIAGNTSAYVASAAATAIDTTNPTVPAAITVATFSNSTSPIVTYTAGTDTNFSTHNVKACAAADCVTGCLSTIQNPASPVTVTSLVTGTAYYICMQTVDLASNVSAYVASGNSVTVDTTVPAAPSALGFSGTYTTSTNLSLAFAVGTDANFSTHDTKLCTAADCATGCGSTVQAVASPVVLTGSTGTTYFGCARTLDLAGNTSAWVPSVGTMTIDATSPIAPSGISVSTYNSSTSVSVTYTAGTDANFATHNVKACTDSNCSTGCLAVTQDAATPATVDSLVAGTSYWICLQTVDQANNLSAYVASGNSVTIDTTSPTAPASPSFASAYGNSTTATISWTNGTDTNFATHNIKACADSLCSASCTATTQYNGTPGSLTGLLDGTSYYACIQSVDLAANTSGWIPSAATRTIDTTNPGEPTAVAFSNVFQLSFTPGTEVNPSTFNLKACTDAGCSAGCVGSTTASASPGQISGAALSVSTAYYGCVQSTDLAGNTSAFVASGAISTRYPYTLLYNNNGSISGSVPTDALTYNNGHTVTVLGNTGALAKPRYNFHSWNTQANGSGNGYTAGQTFVIGAANVTLYAQWILSCSGMVGGTWVAVPGDSIYSTQSFCVQKYAPSNVASVATSQADALPWVNIDHTNSVSTCANLGAGYHLITNPEWMTIAANMANVGSNWSGGTVGSGVLRAGHSDGNPGTICAANASDANAYVESDCAGISSGSFGERRTSNLSNGSVVWDVGGNVWNWINHTITYDKATPADVAWNDFTSLTYTATTPRSLLVPVNSAQSWWNDSWNSAQNVGKYIGGSNNAAGAMRRGSAAGYGSNGGAFTVALLAWPNFSEGIIGFRCAYTPFRLTYNGNGHTSGSVPTDNNNVYASTDSTTAATNSGNLARSGYSFAGWNTTYNGSGTNYATGASLNFSSGSITLYAKWTLDCSGMAGGTWVLVPGNSIYGTRPYCVQKYLASDVSAVPTSQAGTAPWVNINQPSAIVACASLGTGFHLLSNPEWMSVAANLANVGSNWSGSTVGSGTLRRGHSDNNPTNACAANASDANAYVETDCTGTSGGTFVERRTSTLSNGSVVWDIGGNTWNWVNYNNVTDKPTPAINSWYEFTAITGSTTTPKSHLVPLNSAQSWWNDIWNSTQGIGLANPSANSSGGALLRGAGWVGGAGVGAFSASLEAGASASDPSIGFRCAFQPAAARSCLDHLANGNRTNGIYTIDPDETGPIASFSVYCDMTTDGGGWTLLASSYPPDVGLNKVLTLTSPTAAGILVEERLVAIANVGTSVRINGEGKTVISFDGWPISRLQTMQILTDPWNGWGWAHFSGNNDPYLFHYSWADGDRWRFDGMNLHNTIFAASYNGDGLHWGSGVAKWRWNDPNPVYNLDLWVR